jgi:hypothetical protein
VGVCGKIGLGFGLPLGHELTETKTTLTCPKHPWLFELAILPGQADKSHRSQPCHVSHGTYERVHPFVLQAARGLSHGYLEKLREVAPVDLLAQTRHRRLYKAPCENCRTNHFGQMYGSNKSSASLTSGVLMSLCLHSSVAASRIARASKTVILSQFGPVTRKTPEQIDNKDLSETALVRPWRG